MQHTRTYTQISGQLSSSISDVPCAPAWGGVWPLHTATPSHITSRARSRCYKESQLWSSSLQFSAMLSPYVSCTQTHIHTHTVSHMLLRGAWQHARPWFHLDHNTGFTFQYPHNMMMLKKNDDVDVESANETTAWRQEECVHDMKVLERVDDWCCHMQTTQLD